MAASPTLESADVKEPTDADDITGTTQRRWPDSLIVPLAGAALTLRRRLTLLVALALVIPITAIGVTAINLLGNQADQRYAERLRQTVAFARATLVDNQADLERVTRSLPEAVLAPEAERAALDGVLRQMLTQRDLDVVVVFARDGAVIADARHRPAFSTNVRAPSNAELQAGRARGRALVARATVADREVVVGRWLDGTTVRRLARPENVDLLFATGDVTLAATVEGVSPPPGDGDLYLADTSRGRRLVAVAPLEPAGASIYAISTPPEARDRVRFALLLVVVLLLLVVVIVFVGHAVSGVVTRPVDELVQAALAVAGGDLDRRVAVAGDQEIRALGQAFNQMTENLKEQVRELERSRTEFRTAIANLGDALVSTHDIGGIVDVVLEACILTLRAEEAVFYEVVALPSRIRASAAHSGPPPDLELNGVGVAGRAATEQAPVVAPGDVAPAVGEPPGPAVAVPVLVSAGRLFGVVAVYGRQGGGSFGADDVNTLQTLARQAQVAIGNVMLHDETRRQARTDGLTGLWNRREFEVRCHEAVRESARYDDPFGLVLIDIDDFKQINDVFDHTTGDDALQWVASRLSEATREIDVVARWGGEEFIVLLPRTAPGETAVVAERIRLAVARDPMVVRTRTLPLTVSVGYATYPVDGTTAERLFKAADDALLRAKRNGKNRVEAARSTEGVA